MPTIEELAAHLAALPSAVLGYSGGVDSAVLAVVGARVLGPERFVAVIGRSASYPAVQWEAATALAARFAIPLLEVDTHELEDASYVANPVNRCYFCKSELWRTLGGVAARKGFAVLLDGTNDDDLQEHRPGAAAGSERQVHSPFVALGWTKAHVRQAAQALGLPIWDAPAAPCLSSRIEYGLAVTPERLRQVEEAEAAIRGLGVAGDLRVRHHGVRARVEVTSAERPLLERHWEAIVRRLEEIGFDQVELDPRGYRRGGLLPLLHAADRA